MTPTRSFCLFLLIASFLMMMMTAPQTSALPPDFFRPVYATATVSIYFILFFISTTVLFITA